MNISGSFSRIGRAFQLGLFVVSASCGGCGRAGYKSRTWVEDIRGVYNEREAYIFVQTAMSVQADNLTTTARDAAGLYPASDQIQRVRQSLIVLHIKNQNSARFDLERTGRNDSPFFFKGDLYVMRSRIKPGAGSDILRWVGTNFVSLGEEQTLAIRNQFRDEEELMKREGWGQFGAVFNRGRHSFPFSIGNIKYTLILQQDADFYNSTMSVSISGLGSENDKLLLTVDQKLEEITKDDFEKLRRTASNN